MDMAIPYAGPHVALSSLSIYEQNSSSFNVEKEMLFVVSHPRRSPGPLPAIGIVKDGPYVSLRVGSELGSLTRSHGLCIDLAMHSL